MKKLNLTFLNEDNKKATLVPKVARQDLTKDEVKEAMDIIATLALFESNGKKLYVTPRSAHYSETIITELF
ncbi:DUF2922 domain-containing protein [Vagococcus bubulae]|uniref:DUF2922 domain-containing protein n=1 Tax=Vagococcus bubulae TaxID=1977868 RepID=A0A429ZIR7_9ENTE|nr:DUF2922 domain-containing protein [Vagococcus bubulae]RST93575.1 hypothetical protein CBF36_07050 [Vagococcus bubulae]